MIILRPRGKRPYHLESERDKPEQERTVFYLGDLLEKDRVEIMNSVRVSTGEDNSMAMSGVGTRVYRALRSGLKGWENIRYEDGSEVKFQADSDGRASDESLSLLPWEVKQELADAIMGDSLLQEPDVEK